MHENQRISPQTDALNILSSFLLTAVSSVREWDSAEGDIWACAEYINGNIAKYHQSTKPQKNRRAWARTLWTCL